MKKADRQKVFDKFNGKCAYCGCDLVLDNFQVDHIWPKARYHKFIHQRYGNHEPHEFEEIGNLNPSCRECNYEKRSKGIELFRRDMSRKLIQLKRVFNFRIALKYGQIQITESPIKFYYETISR